MRTAFVALVFVPLLAARLALAQDRVETLNVKQFGMCEVLDRVDMFTDQTTYQLNCDSWNTTEENGPCYSCDDRALIEFHVLDHGGFAVAVSNGFHFSAEKTLPVMIRVDRGTVIAGDWQVNGLAWVSLTRDADVFTTLLTEIANGERIAIQVDNEVGTVPLILAHDMVDEFLARIGHISLATD